MHSAAALEMVSFHLINLQIRLMEIHQLRSFVALARTLNFTRAAEQVHVSQSTLSHQIAKLEAQLGTRLFIRGTRRVEMTPDGDLLLSHAIRALAELDSALLSLGNSAEVSISGELRIGATPTFGLAFLPECISRFHASWPLVRVSVQEESVDRIVEQVALGALDFGICFLPPDEESLRFEPLFQEELMLAVGLDHPFAQRRRVRMIELHGLKIALSPASSSTRRVLDDLLHSVGATPQVVVECNSISLAIGLAQHGDIVSVLSEYAVGVTQNMKMIPIESPTPVRTSGLLWKRGVRSSAAAKSMAAVLRDMHVDSPWLRRRSGLRERLPRKPRRSDGRT